MGLLRWIAQDKDTAEMCGPFTISERAAQHVLALAVISNGRALQVELYVGTLQECRDLAQEIRNAIRNSPMMKDIEG